MDEPGELELLDELLEELPPPPPPARFQGVLLFFSISLGALGLGASLAYFTRELRRLPPRVRRADSGRPAPLRPDLKDLVTLPLGPVLGEDPGDAAAARGRPAGSPLPGSRAAAESRGSAPRAPTDAVPDGGPDAGTKPDAPREPPREAAPPETGEKDAPPEPPALTPQVTSAFLKALSDRLESRYDLEVPGLVPPAAPAAEAEFELPRWVNLPYFRRLVSRSLKVAPDLDVSITTKPGRFGGGELILRVGDADAPVFSRRFIKPPATSRVALVVDDVGYGGKSTGELLAVPAPFSVAILPFYPGSKWAAHTSLERDLESMLHLPMQPKGAQGKYRKEVIINREQGASEIARRARRAIESLPGIQGINNHMGSRATESWYVMGEVLPEVRQRGLFFVDSVTSSRSVAYRAAKKLGLKTAKRTTGFLDNDTSYEGVSRAFEGLLEACGPGRVHLAILHDKPDSVRAMAEALPRFRERGVEWVSAGDLVR